MNNANTSIPWDVDRRLTIAAIRAEVAMHGPMRRMEAFERMRCVRQAGFSRYLLCIERGETEDVALQAALQAICRAAMLAQSPDQERLCAAAIEREQRCAPLISTESGAHGSAEG